MNNVYKSPDIYSMGCLNASRIVMLSGIARPMGKEDFDKIAKNSPILFKRKFLIRNNNIFDKKDWVPGDWGYIDDERKHHQQVNKGKI